MPLKGTLSGNYGATVTLTSAGYANPVTVTGTISLASAGIDLQAATAWSIFNQGAIEGPGPNVGGAYGISLGAGGYVENAAGGLIASGGGIRVMGGAGTVVNAGTIAGPVVLLVGGSVTNATGGSISGASFSDAVTIGQPGTVVNYGAIGGDVMGGVVIDGGSLANAASGTIAGATGALLTQAGTVGNAGTISGGSATLDAGIELDGGGVVTNSGSVGGAYGVLLRAGGSVTNAASAVIEGGAYRGVWATGGAGTVSNAGTIESTGSAHSAIYFSAGGSIDNQAGGVVSANYHGIDIEGAAGTVSNAGTIGNTNPADSAIALYDGGTIVNTGTIDGAHHGIYIHGGGTVTNAGTIAAVGSSTIAVLMLPGAANRLIVDPGAMFAGAVDGGNTVGSGIVSTLELSSGSGTLAGLGSGFVDFGAITFDAGAAWTIGGGTAALAGGETIGGFSAGDTIDLVGVSETISGYAGGTLSLGGTAPLDLLLSGSFGGEQFHAAPSSDGTDISVACFVAGTRILTGGGEVAVEHLRPGMRVVSLGHRKLLPIVWIGHRRLRDASPVLVCAHAFAPSLPHRDLWLSPDHAIFIDEAFVPVRYLVNGVTVVQERRDEVVYFHVELAEHGILLAEGLPAESYLDTGNRSAFENADVNDLPEGSASPCFAETS